MCVSGLSLLCSSLHSQLLQEVTSTDVTAQATFTYIKEIRALKTIYANGAELWSRLPPCSLQPMYSTYLSIYIQETKQEARKAQDEAQCLPVCVWLSMVLNNNLASPPPPPAAARLYYV